MSKVFFKVSAVNLVVKKWWCIAVLGVYVGVDGGLAFFFSDLASWTCPVRREAQVDVDVLIGHALVRGLRHPSKIADHIGVREHENSKKQCSACQKAFLVGKIK